MFTQILFLFLVLLMLSFSPSGNNPLPLIYAILGYGVTLGMISLQNYLLKSWVKKRRELLLILANCYILIYLMLFHFFFKTQLFLPQSAFVHSLVSILLFAVAISVFHLTTYPFLSSASKGMAGSAGTYASYQLRLVLPFTIPFVLFSAFVDLLSFADDFGMLFFMSMAFLFLILMILFLPPLLIYLWKCKNIPPGELLDKMEALCKKAHFKHGGMKTWTVLNHAYSAGIIGILPRFRYVMFTKRLLHDLPEEACLAILAHEIGHQYRKHLMLYPLIISGMMIVAGIAAFFLDNLLLGIPPATYPFVLFIVFGLIVTLYYRIIFGFFSRIFERQADLHVYQLNIPPEHMQLALDTLGHRTGGTHHLPCWHHHSLQKRIDFIENTIKNPSLIKKHHIKVKFYLALYLLCFIGGAFILFILSLYS